MNKLFTKIAAAFVGMAMAVGVGVSAFRFSNDIQPVYASDETVTVNIGTYGTKEKWTNSTQYTSITMNADISLTANGGGNTGKYYNTGTPSDWRFYANESATLDISASTGCSLKAVTLTFSVKDNGKISNGSTAMTSGNSSAISGSSASLVVGSTSGSKGKVFISEITVDYTKESSKSLVSISSIGGSLTATEGANEWDYTSVTVTGVLSDSASVVDVKSYVNLSSTTTVPGEEGDYTASVTATSKTDQSVTLTNNSVSATVTAVPGYQLVNSTSSLRNNLQFVIYSGEDTTTKALMSKTQNSGYRGYITYTATGGFIEKDNLPSDAEIITLVSNESHWRLKTSANKYLALTEDGNRLFTLDSPNVPESGESTTDWDISFSGDNAVFTPTKYSGRTIRFNANNGQVRFACYAGTQKAVQMFALKDTSPYFSINTNRVYLGNRGTVDLILTPHYKASANVTWTSSSLLLTMSSTSGLSITITAADSGLIKNATITASFDSQDYDDIVVYIDIVELDTYVNVGVTKFSKQSSMPSGGWAGTYLLVDESAEIIFDGSASPLTAGSEKEVTISNNEITATSDIITSCFNIKVYETGYTVRSNSNYYIGNASAKDKSISTSVGEKYLLDIDNSGQISTTVDDTTTYLRHNASENVSRFYLSSTTSNKHALYKADGEMRAISDELVAWYDSNKSNLVCVDTSKTEGQSVINWTALNAAYTNLQNQIDKDTLTRMTAKSAEDNGNYLEAFMSRYDYCVAKLGYTDFMGREAAGTLSVTRANQFSLFALDKNASATPIIIIISVVSVSAIGGYFFLRKRKEQ